jgi:hypothetical protein
MPQCFPRLGIYFFLFAFTFFLALAGCSKTPVSNVKGEVKAETKGRDPWTRFLETVRYTESTRAGDEWTRFRAGCEQLNSQMAKADLVGRMREQSIKQRKFLEEQIHLTEDELAEVESPSFRTADAHYLDECFLLRDVASSLNIAGLAPMDQAQLYFDWVMRNVLPHEQTDSWTPPAFTLRRGHGSPLERSLVFLALLRQAQIEGCLLVVPELEPKQFLVAVLDGNGTTSHLHLFDPSLGLPLRSKEGGAVLTLKQALAEPALLHASQITPDQLKQLEAWLVCPLYALSPRLRELQIRLIQKETIVLHLNAPDLASEVAKATTLPIKVWNPPAKGPTLPNSPTRCLRLFLPKQEGGLDETGRSAMMARARVPLQRVLVNYAQIDFTENLLPKSAFELMKGITVDFFNKFDLQPREMYLHGQYDSMTRRYERLQPFAQDDLLIGLGQDPKFRKELVDWQRKMSSANADSDSPDPGVRSRARQEMQSLWSNDQFVSWMLDLSKEDKLDHQHKKTVLTRILGVGMREYFDLEMARMRASLNQEKAAQAQAILKSQKTPAARQEARDAWGVAKSSWSAHYLDHITLDAMIDQQWKQLRQVGIEQPELLDKRLSLLESLHLEIHKYFQAKLRLAECLEHREGGKAAKEYLESIKAEIVALEKKGLLQTEVKTLTDLLPRVLPRPALPFFQKRLDLLGHDWSPQGNYFWLRQQADQRILRTQG